MIEAVIYVITPRENVTCKEEICVCGVAVVK